MNDIPDGPPYLIGQDFVVGDYVDLTYCDCPMCTAFRNLLSSPDAY
jgi:hypothetical protein